MESEVGSPAVTGASLAAAPKLGNPGSWIVSPLFDLFFFANLLWLLALLPGFVSAEGTPHVEFWQLYFLTTPHRWITLVLVATDPERREGRTWLFIVIAILAAVLVLGAWLVTGAFVCLLLIDYIWNGWHFASQHAGILRIYSRKSGGGRAWLESTGLRVFIFYTIARTAGWSTGWLEDVDHGLDLLYGLDLLMLGLPVILLAVELSGGLSRRIGKLIYLASVCGVYAALLLALRGHHTILILALTAASAAFHAVEYLALVTHYAWRRSARDEENVFASMAQRWLAFLATYLVLLGLGAWLMEGRQWWLGLNLWAAFLHYAYDGLIWKLRRPATAQALGAESPVSASAA